MVTILDGPVGTQLALRGLSGPAPLWSAWALMHAPDVIAQIHREYAAAGATVHTTNTFRTRERTVGNKWVDLTRLAALLARSGVPAGHRVAGSIAPIEDCYRPDLSPRDPRPEHRAMARALAAAGVDLILCETFPHIGEWLIAVEEAVSTGLPTWASLTAGPGADLLTPDDVAKGAKQAAQRGVSAVLVNCIPASRTLAYVEALREAGVPFGAYANSGAADEGIGWGPAAEGPLRYADVAAQWIEAGATLVGSCCGTGPEHIAELARRFGGR